MTILLICQAFLQEVIMMGHTVYSHLVCLLVCEHNCSSSPKHPQTEITTARACVILLRFPPLILLVQ